MGTVIVLIILTLVICISARGSLKHFKGGGGCCGGNSSNIKVKKQKLSKVVAKKKIVIEGMTCRNCRNNVENALNSINNVNAKVYLSKKEAVASLGEDISDDVFIKAISKKGYKVVSVQDI